MPTKYIPYSPEPIEGQAILSYPHLLKYRGASDAEMKIQRGMPYYEMEKVESVGENADGNMVIRGECISACAYLKDKGIKVDLVYIDPPFASGADYAKKVYIRRNPKVAEAIAKAEEELDDDELKAFEEKMYGDVWDKEKYLNWMWENLMAIKSVMSETASIYVHLDWHIGHYVKVLMDEVFGEDKFRNEISWCYSGGGIPKHDMPHKHDLLFWYTMSPELEEWNDQWVYNVEYREYSEGTIQRGRTKVKGENAQLREEGTPINDWWIDIPKITSPTDPEKLDYATQKSEALLNRIIKIASNKDMLVADFFGGSGTTVAAASKLGRKFIHCDIGLNSIQTTRDRLIADGAQFDVLEIKDGVQLYRNPVQTMDKIKSLIPGLKNEDSLDSFWEGAISDSKLGTVPVYVPNLMDSTSKLLDKVMINRIIHQAIPELDDSVKKVVVYYIDIEDVDEIEKFIKDDDSTTVEIELRDLKTILDDVVIGDYAEFHVDESHETLLGGYVITIDKFVSDRVASKIADFNQKSLATGKKQISISDEGLELIEFLSVDTTSKTGEWHSDSEIKIDKNGYVIKNGQKTKKFWDCTIECESAPLRLKIRNICGDETIWEVNR